MSQAALVLLLTVLPAQAWAVARVTLEVNTQKLTPDDELRVTVRASGTFDEMTEPEVEGWEIRRTGQQQQLSLIGGSMQRTETLVYAATPGKPGTYKFGPIVLLDGSAVVAKSDVVMVEVLAPRVAEDVQSAERATELAGYVGNAFFVHPTLSTNQPFVGQPLVVTYTLYWSRQRPIAGIKPIADPSYGKLEAESLRDNTMLRAESVVLSGHPYQRQVTHRDLLVATTPGPLRLEGPRYRVEMLDARAQKVAPPTIELQVRPVPTQGRPPGFVDGNVGRLHIAGALEAAGGKVVQSGGGKLEVLTGERVGLTVTVAGDGNLLGLKPLALPQVDGMTAEIVVKRDDEGVSRTSAGVQGKRTWQWMLSFDRPGRVQVPPMPWVCFDPFQEHFDAQTVGPFEIEVRGPALATAVTTTGEDAAGVTPGAPVAVHASQRLRPNAAEARLAAGDGRPWTQSQPFRFLLALPWLILIATLVAYGIRRRKARAAPEHQRRAALHEAQTRLRATAATEPGQGYAEARRIVAEYLAEVARLEIGGLTEQAVVDELQRRAVAADVAKPLAADLQHCDFGRFAPAGDRQSDLAQTTERLCQQLGQIDAVLLRSPLPAATKFVALLVLTAAATIAHPVHAATLDQTFAAANRAYASEDYAKAKSEYDALLSHDLPVAAVHYNLGNTLVQLGHLGRAVAQYQAALQLRPDAALRADVSNNLQAVRAELTDRARRHHATLHVFDESASLDVMFAQSAPRGVLGALAVLAGLLASGLLAWHLLGRTRPGPQTRLHVAIAVLGALHVLALSLLLWADASRDALVQAVVVEEDAQLTACVGQEDAEDLGLPEGLEVRKLAEMADGRVRVRLPNGREGCLHSSTLEVEATPAR